MVLLNKKCRVSGSIGLPFELVKSCSVPIVHITALPIEFDYYSTHCASAQKCAHYVLCAHNGNG